MAAANFIDSTQPHQNDIIGDIPLPESPPPSSFYLLKHGYYDTIQKSSCQTLLSSFSTVSALARKTVREVQEVFSVRLVDIAIVVVIVSCLKRLYRYLSIQEANQPKGSEEVEEKSP
ncbi:hypothetical protein ACJJTC_015093 [Scirpophaga incertulas]